MSTYQPIRYQASSPEAKYLGVTLMSFLTSLRSDTVAPIMEKHNIKRENFDPASYYTMQDILDVLKDIELKFSFEELVAIGIKAGEITELPPEINSIEAVLNSLGTIYNAILTQNVPAEETVITHKLGPSHYQLTYVMPTPPYPTYGYLYGMLRRVRQPNQHFTISIVDYASTPYDFIVKW